MQSEIQDKIRKSLCQWEVTEERVVWLAVKLRKLVEHLRPVNDSSAARAIWAYASWPLHNAIDRQKTAESILEHFESPVRKALGAGLLEQGKHLLADEFRKSLIQFLGEADIDASRFECDRAWRAFWEEYCSAVSDCPVTLGDNADRGLSSLKVSGGLDDLGGILDPNQGDIVRSFYLEFVLDGKSLTLALPYATDGPVSTH